jgi:hypothetical protein
MMEVVRKAIDRVKEGYYAYRKLIAELEYRIARAERRRYIRKNKRWL